VLDPYHVLFTGMLEYMGKNASLPGTSAPIGYSESTVLCVTGYPTPVCTQGNEEASSNVRDNKAGFIWRH
jgi:hypothetical protein